MLTFYQYSIAKNNIPGNTQQPDRHVAPALAGQARVYASIVKFGLRLLYNCNTRYEWLVRPYSPGTSTLEETPSFAWRTDGLTHQMTPDADYKMPEK
jgi:hypothetical protein